MTALKLKYLQNIKNDWRLIEEKDMQKLKDLREQVQGLYNIKMNNLVINRQTMETREKVMSIILGQHDFFVFNSSKSGKKGHVSKSVPKDQFCKFLSQLRCNEILT